MSREPDTISPTDCAPPPPDFSSLPNMTDNYATPPPDLSSPPPPPDTIDNYAPPPPDLSSPLPPDTTYDYAHPPPDLSSPPPPDTTDDYAPPPPDLSSPPPPVTIDDYAPPPPDLSSPLPPKLYTFIPFPPTPSPEANSPSPSTYPSPSPPISTTPSPGGRDPPPPDLSSPPPPKPDTSITFPPTPSPEANSPSPSTYPSPSPPISITPSPGGRDPPPPDLSSPPPPKPDTSIAFPPTPSPEANSPSPSTYPPPPPPIPTTPSPGGRSSSTGLMVGIAIGSVVVLAVVLTVVLIWNKKRKRRPHPNPPSSPLGPEPEGDHFVRIPPKHSPSPVGPIGPPRSPAQDPSTPLVQRISIGFSTSSFTYEELSRATDGFSTANFLGKGGFGYVHRGVLPNGQEIAVKWLKTGSTQEEPAFQAEVEIIGRVHHKHLVSLIGFCITGLERMLVYEFVQNNTLELHLHGKGRPTMNWPTRSKIALGAARGVAYLHEDCHPRIIHRNIKASNILLDSNFEAKVADFGLAKFYPDGDTHFLTRVVGTFGYLAPEYTISGKLTEKSDVFSFGVVLLELITGRLPIPVDTTQPCMDDSLVGWAGPLLTRALEDGNFEALVDPRLQMDYKQNEMARIVACASACVRFSAKLRPPMSQVVRTLEGNLPLSHLNEGLKPGHSSQGSSVNYDTAQYNEDMKKFRKSVLPTGDSGASSDLYSIPTTTANVDYIHPAPVAKPNKPEK